MSNSEGGFWRRLRGGRKERQGPTDRLGTTQRSWGTSVSRPSKRPAVKPQERRALPMSGNFQLRSMRRAWRQFQEGSLSHWITTTVIALSLTIYATLSLLLVNVESIMEQWRGDNTMVVFLHKASTPQDAETIRAKIASLPNIGAIQTVSPEEALTRMKRMMAKEAGLLDELDENPLPLSMEFSINSARSEAEELAEQISQWSGVEAVDYDVRWANRLEAVVQVFRYTGNVLSGLLLTAVALIISNTIKLTIIARRDEVEVMRFMGATDGFIKTPFIYEGLLQGLFGGALALILTAALYTGAREAAMELGTAFGITLSMHFLPMEYLALILGLGLFLGLFGALLSVSRFLKV